jgi:hypothetical protein
MPRGVGGLWLRRDKYHRNTRRCWPKPAGRSKDALQRGTALDPPDLREEFFMERAASRPVPLAPPHPQYYLPELIAQVRDLARKYAAGTLVSWEQMSEWVQWFFTPARLDQVEAVVPGWRAMASLAGGATLTHITAVLTALFLSPEYRRARAEEQALMEWIVLFHDIMKRGEPGKRDHVHGFRSAVNAGQALPALGFPVTDDYAGLIEDWARLTHSAITRPNGRTDEIQDNRQLPAIMAGIDQLYGQDASGALIVKAVLLHMSITVVQDWPQAAPLTEAEIEQYVSTPLFPLLQAMMLADNDGWALFDPGRKEQDRRETLARLAAIRRLRSG